MRHESDDFIHLILVFTVVFALAGVLWLRIFWSAVFLVEAAEDKLTDDEKKTFYPKAFALMTENMDRVQKDVEWFVAKNDYLNKDKDWGNAADSIQRGMQKCTGGYPADPIFKAKL